MTFNGTEVNTAHIASIRIDHQKSMTIVQKGQGKVGTTPEVFVVVVKLAGGQTLQQRFPTQRDADDMVARLKSS